MLKLAVAALVLISVAACGPSEQQVQEMINAAVRTSEQQIQEVIDASIAEARDAVREEQSALLDTSFMASERRIQKAIDASARASELMIDTHIGWSEQAINGFQDSVDFLEQAVCNLDSAIVVVDYTLGGLLILFEDGDDSVWSLEDVWDVKVNGVSDDWFNEESTVCTRAGTTYYKKR